MVELKENGKLKGTITRYSSGYSAYLKRKAIKKFNTVDEYVEDLNGMLEYCRNFFAENPGIELEEYDPSKKILTHWGQVYDIDQLMEHAIVHVLKHRRQIQRFLSS